MFLDMALEPNLSVFILVMLLETRYMLNPMAWERGWHCLHKEKDSYYLLTWKIALGGKQEAYDLSYNVYVVFEI